MIKTNFIKREIDELTELGITYPKREELLKKLHPSMQSAIENDSFLNRLVTRAINNSIFQRNADTKEFRNYWLPLGNAGLAAVPRPSHFHESCFLVHDILHHNFPDLIIDKKSVLGRKVYIIQRVLGEAITLVLADAYAVDLAVDSGKIKKEENPSRWIYPYHKKTFPNISKDLSELKEALITNARYVILGEEYEFDNISWDEGVEKYQKIFKVVYEGDLKWTAHNFDNFKTNDLWSSWVKNYVKTDPCSVIFLTDFIKEQGICESMSIEEIMNKILDWYFNIIFDKTTIVPISDEEGYTQFSRLFKIFNLKGLIELGKCNLDQINKLVLLDIDDFYNQSKKLNPKRDINGGIFPIFDNMYISYEQSNKEIAPLKEICDRILLENNQLFLFKELVNLTDGTIERSRIITKPGIILLNNTESKLDNKIEKLLNLNTKHSDIDLNAKITYLSDKDGLLEQVLGLGHYSITNSSNVGVLLVGVSINTLIEFCSTNAKISRMNTDTTRTHQNSLYTVVDRKEIKYIEEFYRVVREKYKNDDEIKNKNIELQNRFNLKQQSMICSVSFSIQDWLLFFARRFGSNQTTELEFFQVSKRIYQILRQRYETIFPKLIYMED